MQANKREIKKKKLGGKKRGYSKRFEKKGDRGASGNSTLLR